MPEPGAGMAVLGLNEAINRQLPALVAQSDLVILLAFANEAEMRLLPAITSSSRSSSAATWRDRPRKSSAKTTR